MKTLTNIFSESIPGSESISGSESTSGGRWISRCLLVVMMLQVFDPVVFAYNNSEAPLFNEAYFTEQSTEDTASSSVFTDALNSIAVDIASRKYVHASAAKLVVRSTSGPGGQTESSGFSLNTASDMVDPFTGDFSYSLPLMDVEGYPITLSYNSNVGMLDEASWVGLGWNLNVGSVSREKRGLPDEFDGSQNISTKHYQKPDMITDGKKLGAILGMMKNADPSKRLSLAGADFSLLWGNYTNTYTGYGRTFDFNVGATLATPFGSEDGENQAVLPLRFGMGYSRDTKNGIGRSSTMGFARSYVPDGKDSPTFGVAYGSNYSTRKGVAQRGVYLFNTPSLGNRVRMDVGILGSTFTCGTTTYVPRVLQSTHTVYKSTILDLYYGYMKSSGAKFGYSATIEGQDYATDEKNSYYSDESDYTINSPAFGYFYAAKRDAYTGTEPPVMDFNREREAEFSEEMKNLPYAFATYDVFYVNGYGLGGTFRGQRNDIGVYKDATVIATNKTKANQNLLGLQTVGADNRLAVGFTHTGGDGTTESGQWVEGEEFFSFGADSKISFKGIGEPTPKVSDLMGELGGAAPSYLELTKTESPPAIYKSDQLITGSNTSTLNASALAAENTADRRATIYRPLTPGQVTAAPIGLYDENEMYGSATTNFVRTDAVHLSNHISGVEVVNTGGMKYFYGLPVYSINDSQVGFATEVLDADAQGLMTYIAENAPNNGKGLSEYYDKATTPSYASAFLLTNVVSSDYVDISSDGFTLDDPGNYYKINYSRIYDKDNSYKWRMPYPEKSAFFNENFLTLESDNMGNYSYGEKEIWYTHSVESKNMVAEFTISDRIDAYGVDGEDGGMNLATPLKKLDKITLYNRSERLADKEDAVAIMTIEFTYDYSLCPKNPANSNYATNPTGDDIGKLTLKEIRVYSGPTSEETALAPIKFTYGSGDANPEFNYQNTDRWGAYKPDNDLARPMELFPYAEQDQETADDNAKAWKLIRIESPGGSSMDISYAADHYSFVQNRRAMRHMDISGFTTQWELMYLLDQSTWDGSTYMGNSLHKSIDEGDLTTLTGLSSGAVNQLIRRGKTVVDQGAPELPDVAMYGNLDEVPCNVVIFELDAPLSGGTQEELEVEFREQYLKKNDIAPVGDGYIDEVYFRDFINIKDNRDPELIPAFASIKKHKQEDIGSFPFTGLMPPVGGAYKYGYIVLQTVNSNEDNGWSVGWMREPVLMNPLEKSAMEFARLNLTEIVYMNAPGQDGDLTVDNGTFWRGDIYRVMMENTFCKSITTDMPSQLRLCDPDGVKYGGGAYVKSIVIHDNWDVLSGEYKSSYGWYWNRMNTAGRVTSYGVAAYEPSIGGDENAFFYWDRYKNRAVSFPDETCFNVAPIGESLYPNPVVGYEKLSLQMKGFQYNAEEDLIYETAALRDGFSEMEFYTAYDQPTKTLSTGLQKESADNFSIFKNEIDLYGFSQGHLVITNNFHGQPKEFRTYDQFGVLQATTTYNYRGLGEKVNMLNRSGIINDERVAMEYDAMVDSRLITSEYESTTLGATVSLDIPSFVPVSVSPTINGSRRQVGYYSHVINKHINYSVMLESVETVTLGSSALAENLLYDSETGQVILSALNDEYNDKLYSFAYPAHWYYTLFRSPLENTGIVTGTLTGNQLIASAYLANILTVGDKVSITNGTSTITAWVLTIDGLRAYLIDFNGNPITPITGTCTVSVLESGRKNILSSSMQSVVTKRNPVSGSTFTFPAADVIQAGAVTFRPKLNVLCDETAWESGIANSVPIGRTINPFRYGLLNNLITEHSYAPQLELSSIATQGLRFNSVYANYYSFYALNTNGYWSKIDETSHPDSDVTDLKRWRPSGSITVTDELGNVTEAKDPINVSSAVLYGYNKYNKLIPVAQAVNAKQNEIAFDSFEDYDYMDDSNTSLIEGHFNFAAAIADDPSVLALSSEYRHSGLKSLKITGNNSAGVSKAVIRRSDCEDPLDSFSGSEYEVEECMCVKEFEPYQGREYVIGLWIKGNRINSFGDYSTCYVNISYSGSATTHTFYPTGQKIDGWQRVEGVFTIPGTATGITVALRNTFGSGTAYFDDVRIHPFLGGMTTTVYDPETLLPMATHDGYNFTTFYGYDENLAPVRVRVETIEGIQTVTEQESSTIMEFKQ